MAGVSRCREKDIQRLQPMEQRVMEVEEQMEVLLQLLGEKEEELDQYREQHAP